MPLILSTTLRESAPVAERLSAWRVVAKPAAIDRLSGIVLRLASDDALVVGVLGVEIGDPEAIVEPDTGWVFLELSEERALELIAAGASWRPPAERPAFAQGMLAGLPAKIYLNGARSLVIVAAPFEHELEERLGH